MGNVIKYAISAGDGRVCKGCRDVEGQEVKQYDYFETQWGNVLFPPFHTDCRCAVEYEEISEPEDNKQIHNKMILLQKKAISLLEILEGTQKV